MEYTPEQRQGFSNIVEDLMSMFGNVVCRDVITTVVESYDGDMNLAAEALMNITSDVSNNMTESVNNSNIPTTEPSSSENSNTTQALESINLNTHNSTCQPIMSYARASRSTGAVPKQMQSIPRKSIQNKVIWTDQLRRVITYHNQGSRTLILMRGVPGIGKSTLAKQIVDMTVGTSISDHKTHIYSTDDYFLVNGVYQYDRSKLEEGHIWNHNRVQMVLDQGLSPVIVDNTNIKFWEMEPYIRAGVKNGYIIEIFEPNTPWAGNAYQLAKKNSHCVPLMTIRKMLDHFKSGITSDFMIKYYALSYPANLVPPVMRTKPAIQNVHENIPKECVVQGPESSNFSNSMLCEINNQNTELESRDSHEQQSVYAVNKEKNALTLDDKVLNDVEVEVNEQKRFLEIQKQLEELEKVEQEWENGENWDVVSQETVSSSSETFLSADPKPPRSNSAGESMESKKTIETVQKYEDWSQISMFMSPWKEQSPSQNVCVDTTSVETVSSSTCMEMGDTDLRNPKKTLKIITAVPRDINLFHISYNREKIPDKRMLDKSTVTNELLINEAYRCQYEEQHFTAFRKLFRKIPKPVLRDVFDKCCGDVNWAVDIVLEGMASNQLGIADDEAVSEDEEESKGLCNCLAAYDIIPDVTSQPTTTDAVPQTPVDTAIIPQRKSKIMPSENALQLKRQMEKNIVISDNHYSDHCLKVRKMRRGEYNTTEEQESQNNLSNDVLDQNNAHGNNLDAPCTNIDKSYDEESSASSLDQSENIININVGFEFLGQLDELYGRKNMTYPDNIVPKISIPMSLLNEINAFWMESLMHQLDEIDKQKAIMLEEDADFARRLAMKEAELAQQGKEPEVPDFKEIMDMDLALSLYQKDVAEWRNKEPNDLAAKMSREKLYNLFPDLAKDTLSELLMAHENNFQTTVEVLLMSTGQTNILEEKNGLNKFVMKKEMERQERLLQEEKKALSEVEWPLLTKGARVEMSTVNEYRAQAEKHLAYRNLNIQKAQDYIRRGMTQVAAYYSEIAAFHKQMYEQANSYAAASMVHVHASNSPDNATIDLHFLRVGEAKETLDLFLDSHIQKLKDSQNKGPKYHTLYFITGRGVHSKFGVPRVKPAIKKRLRERALLFSELNPGLLTTKVCADDKLTHQIQLP